MAENQESESGKAPNVSVDSSVPSDWRSSSSPRIAVHAQQNDHAGRAARV